MRRHKFEIIASILKRAKDGTRKTRLVYETNLNFTMLGKYMKILSEKGFINSSNGKLYTTMKGIEFLEKYDELMMLWHLIEFDRPTPISGPNSEEIGERKFSKIL